MTITHQKLSTYLALSAGATCLTTTADAAVTFYGRNSINDTNPHPTGFNFGVYFSSKNAVDSSNSVASVFLSSGGTVFTRGTDLGAGIANLSANYDSSSGFYLGAVAGSNNYANISLNGNDGVYEAVGQFELTNDYLIAIASNTDGSALSISAGKAMIDAASVPEPSSLALLALGASGLLARRRRT